MTDDSELDEILHELKSPTTDNYQLVAEAKQAILAWSERREAAAVVRELQRLDPNTTHMLKPVRTENAATLNGKKAAVIVRQSESVADRINHLTSDRTGGGEETK